MRHFTTQTVQDEVLVCDRCGKENDIRTLDRKQAFSFSFRGGYGSTFGDGNLIEGDFCDQCIRDTLGQHFHVSGADLFTELATLPPKDWTPYYFDMYERKLLEAEGLFRSIREAIGRKRRALIAGAQAGGSAPVRG